MKNLAYYQVNYIMPIYLEYAPIGIFDEAQKQSDKIDKSVKVEEEEEKQEDDNDELVKEDKTVFVKNLNFDTLDE